MLKIVKFIIAAAVLVAAAWLLSRISGRVVATVGDLTVEMSAPMAILLLIVLVALVLVLVRILGAIFGIPRSGLRWRRRHRLALGERSVTRLLIALAAGDQKAARQEARRARSLIGDSPQTLLLAAEAGRLAGREDEAEAAYRALAAHKDAGFLGLRGLLRQAVDRGDLAEARVLARQAEAAHPGASWLREQRAELALQAENWAEALQLIGQDSRGPVYAVAAAAAEPDPNRAMAYAKQAWKQDPAFVPAALAYAARLRAVGKEKRALACIYDAWKRNPHPDLAAFALAREPDAIARAQAAKRLTAANPLHPESRYLLARTALDAGLTGEARHQIEAAEQDGLQQRRFFLLLADIEEQERGDTTAGRDAQREALRRAATAAPDPNWACANCHTEQHAWQPKCPACGNIGSIQWRSMGGVPQVPLVVT